MDLLLEFVDHLEENFNRMFFIPLLFMLDGIIATYFYIRLSQQMQKRLFFTATALLFFLLCYSLAETLEPYIDHRLSTASLYGISAVGSVLLYFAIEFISEVMEKIGIFLAGTVISLVLILIFSSPTVSYEKNSHALIIAAVAAIICGGAFYKMMMAIKRGMLRLFEKHDSVKIYASACTGASVLAAILTFSGPFTNMDLLEAVGSTPSLIPTMGLKRQLLLIPAIAVSGMIVQSILLQGFKRKQRKAESRKEAVVEQVRVTESVG